MDVQEIANFLDERLYIVVIAIYFIGVCLKKIPGIPDWTIPFILTVISIIICIGITGFDMISVVQGIIVTAVSVLGNQYYSQIVYKRAQENQNSSSNKIESK